jgi:hypothetical protein
MECDFDFIPNAQVGSTEMRNKIVRRILLSIFLACLTLLSGCLLKYINLERIYIPPKYSAPYGAYFVKPNMTREGRLEDFAACGNHGGLYLKFTKEQIEEEEAKLKPTEVIDVSGRRTGKFSINWFGALVDRLVSCMKSKGYIQLPRSACESNEAPPPQCMYP